MIHASEEVVGIRVLQTIYRLAIRVKELTRVSMVVIDDLVDDLPTDHGPFLLACKFVPSLRELYPLRGGGN